MRYVAGACTRGIAGLCFMAVVSLPHLMLCSPWQEQTREEECKEDRRPRSLVFVERENVQALFNFLLNSRACFSPTGPLAGVPPTLLAPVAFHGATLRSLKVCWCFSISNAKRWKPHDKLKACAFILFWAHYYTWNIKVCSACGSSYIWY